MVMIIINLFQTDYVANSTTKFNIGWIYIVLIGLLLMINFIGPIYYVIKKLVRRKILAKIKHKKIVK